MSSSYLALDQHYPGFTQWAGGLPRHSGSNLRRLFFSNQNMAAEYHVLFLPIALGLLFYTRSLALRIILLLLISFLLLPALTLSLARGAWVGLLVGGIVVVTLDRHFTLPSSKSLGRILSAMFVSGCRLSRTHSRPASLHLHDTLLEKVGRKRTSSRSATRNQGIGKHHPE